MMQVIEMTDKERMKMYMALPKKQLAKMLIECNKYFRTQIVEKLEKDINQSNENPNSLPR